MFKIPQKEFAFLLITPTSRHHINKLIKRKLFAMKFSSAPMVKEFLIAHPLVKISGKKYVEL